MTLGLLLMVLVGSFQASSWCTFPEDDEEDEEEDTADGGEGSGKTAALKNGSWAFTIKMMASCVYATSLPRTCGGGGGGGGWSGWCGGGGGGGFGGGEKTAGVAEHRLSRSMHPYELVCSRSVALPYPALACRRRYIGCVMHNTGFWTICDIYVPNSQVSTACTATPWLAGSMGAPVRGMQLSAGCPTVDRADCGCACVCRGPCATSLATCSGALTNMALPLSPNSTGPRVYLHLCRPGGHVARRVSAPLQFI